jgi:Farnesoic acid 0-methyl transferase
MRITCKIYIGGFGNTKSAMRFGNVERNQYMETGIVSETEFREFWVSWFDGSIQCGKGGEIGVNRFLAWTDPEFAGINHLSVATGYGSNGTWIFNDDLGREIPVQLSVQSYVFEVDSLLVAGSSKRHQMGTWPPPPPEKAFFI